MPKLTSKVIRSRIKRGQPQAIELSVRDGQAFAKALLTPQPVNARLRETVRLYRETASV